MSHQLPPAALVVTHPITDWDKFTAAFNGHEGFRKEAGVLGHHINRGADDANTVSVYLAVADVDKAKAMLSSPELKAAMEGASVSGPPTFTWLTPVSESVVWDRELPAMMISHTVSDFDTWFAGYQAADDLRKAAGIVGHAANRSMDDPSTVVVYHQAESFDALKAFMANPELKDAMEKAGVTSKPEVTYWTGGWAKMYA